MVVETLETERLILRPLSADDAAFILELLNEPPFIRNIGDKGVRTEEDARGYIANGPVESYARLGFGLLRVELKATRESIGICGLIKREGLAEPDLGFAFLMRHWSKGYAFEAASAVKAHAANAIGLKRILAITTPDNQGSIRVLEKIGFRPEGIVKMADDGEELKLFAAEIKAA